MIDPVEHLARDDKWQLGAGDVAFGPLFTITVLDDEGRELAAKVTARRWTPAELTLQYRLGQGLTATEVRTVHPGGIFAKVNGTGESPTDRGTAAPGPPSTAGSWTPWLTPRARMRRNCAIPPQRFCAASCA